MSFNSLSFLIYLPIVVILYYLLPHKIRYIWLLIASYYFYMSWNPYLVFLILGTTIISYLFALLMEKTNKQSLRKLYLSLTLVICLGVLFFFKYFNFLLGSIIDFLNLFSLNISSFSLDLILPVGISFYTFQTLSYVIDVYRGDFNAEKNFFYYALFVSFFPQLVAGPIERPGDLLPQLKEKHTFSSDNLLTGMKFLVSGFYRKVVIADFFGIFVNKVFNSLESGNSLSVFLALAFFLIQIYNDFAGYSEIALGSAKLLGVNLSVNFSRPYLSCSFGEYFRRWHITLNRWFTDYLYIPLGGSRKGKVRKIINLFIVFGLSGLWHGASWTYLLWGINAAFYISLETLLRKPVRKFLKESNINIDSLFVKTLRRTLMFLLFCFAAIFFRSSDFHQIAICFTKIFTGFSSTMFTDAYKHLGLNQAYLILIPLLLVSMCFLYYFANSKNHIAYSNIDAFDKKEVTLKEERYLLLQIAMMAFLIFVIALFWFYLLSLSSESQFTYFQF